MNSRMTLILFWRVSQIGSVQSENSPKEPLGWVRRKGKWRGGGGWGGRLFQFYSRLTETKGLYHKHNVILTVTTIVILLYIADQFKFLIIIKAYLCKVIIP